MHEVEAGLLSMWGRLADRYEKDAAAGDTYDQAVFTASALTLRLCMGHLEDTLALRSRLQLLSLEVHGAV